MKPITIWGRKKIITDSQIAIQSCCYEIV